MPSVFPIHTGLFERIFTPLNVEPTVTFVVVLKLPHDKELNVRVYNPECIGCAFDIPGL